MNSRIAKWIALGATAICAVLALWLVLSYRTRALTLERDRSQAERTKAFAEAKSEEERRVAADRKLAAERQKAENLRAEDELKEKTIEEERAKAEAEEAKRDRIAEEKDLEDEKLKVAEENRKAKEAEKASLELAIELAGATNETLRAQLELSRSQRELAERTAAANEAALKTQELLQADYAKLIEEQKELNEILRQREEDSRPDKTIAMLMEENEAQRRLELGEDWVPDYEYSEQPTYELHEGPATGFKKPTANDRKLADIGRRIDEMSKERSQVIRRRIVSNLEGLMKRAIKDGRREDAEFYYDSLVSLVPDYALAKESASEKGNASEKVDASEKTK